MKKRVFGILIGVVLVIIGCVLITEGGFYNTHIADHELPKYAAETASAGAPYRLEYSASKDAAVSAYLDKNNLYICEFSRNTVFNRYSLVDTHVYFASDSSFHSVVSTAFYDYPYSVDPSDLSIRFFEKNISNTCCYSLFILLLGGAILGYSLKRKG